MDSILIFGAGENQRTLIKTAKKLGYRTVVIDPDPFAAAIDEADIFEVIDARDKQSTITVAKKYNVKGIVTSQMENPLLLMADIAEEMGFIFPKKDSVLKARNKWLMKQAFISNHVQCANGFLLKQSEDLPENKLNELHFPQIIKPLDSFSSRGVYKVNSVIDIREHLSETRKFSSSGEVIIEEFMEGPEVSVESITYKGITDVIQITDKVITPYPNTVEMAHIQPSRHEPETQEAIKTIVIKAVNSLGLDNCATHAEVKVTSEGVKMVEIGARLGGDFITSHLVPLSTGVDIEAAAVQVSMGINPDLKKKFSKGSAIQYLQLPEGEKIMSVGTWEEIFNEPSVKHAMVNGAPGDIIPFITDSAKRLGFVIVQCATSEEAFLKARQLSTQMCNKIRYN